MLKDLIQDNSIINFTRINFFTILCGKYESLFKIRKKLVSYYKNSVN